MSRKTFNVAQLQSEINQILRTSTCSSEIRQGEINILKSILHKTDNYAGYQYLSKIEVPEGELPGINTDGNGQPLIDPVLRFENTDRTRVFFFFHKGLSE